MKQVRLKGIEDFSREFLPEGRGDPDFFRNQLTDPRRFRPLKKEEIESLIKNNNSAESWDQILVTDQFDPNLVKNCEFWGLVRIGDLTPAFLEADDLRLPVGLYNSTIISCDFGDHVAVRNVSHISHYVVGDRCVLFELDELVVTANAKFGNGVVKEGESEDDRVWIELANENGNRAILPFAGILPADAYLWSRNRADKIFQRKLIELTDQLAGTQPGQYGQIGSHSVIRNSRLIHNVNFGSHCLVSGANRLDNLTILSNEQEPTEIREGVELINGIVGYGNHILYGVKAINFITGRNVNLKYGARFLHTFLGDNSTVSCCEVLNNLLYPFHEQHHNNSFLIATTVQGQANIAAGATIGSNHNSRAPDGEIFAERGFWPGLCSNFKHNSYFGPFALLAKGNYYSELNIKLPFALVSPGDKNNEINIYPGYWFKHNMYALARNSWKFKKRDKRVVKEQHIETEYLAPDTVEAMFKGMELLKKAINQAAEEEMDVNEIISKQREIDAELKVTFSDFVYHGVARVLKPAQGLHLYYQMIEYYGGLALYQILRQQKMTSVRALKNYLNNNLAPFFREWENVGGQLVPREEIQKLKDEIKSGKLDSWEKIHQRYNDWWQAYPALKESHAFHSLLNLYQISIDDLTAEKVRQILQTVQKVAETLSNNAFKSREKDYTNPFRKMTYENEQEMEAVLGKVEDNSFLIEQREEVDQLKTQIHNLLNQLSD